MLEEVLGQSQRSGVSVFRTTADELERRRPFGAIIDCLEISARGDDRRAAIASLLSGDADHGAGEASGLEGPHLEFRVTEAILALVEDLCAEGPVILCVEDLQWADPSTLLTLHRIGREVGQLPLLVLLSARPLPRSTEHQRLLDGLSQRGWHHLALGPLDENAVGDLIRLVLGGEPAPSVLEQAAGAGGNPLFVIELVSALSRDDIAHRAGSERQSGVWSALLPASLMMTILHFLSFFADDVQEVLQMASILGSTFAVTDLSLLTRRSTAELAGTLQTAIRGGVLTERGDDLAFRHDLIREALYEDLPSAVRQSLHLDAGRALAASGGQVERVAQHLALGASPGDRQAIDWLRRAADHASARSPAVATDLLARAVELAAPDDEDRDSLLAGRAVGLVWAGRVREGEQLCREILDRDHLPSVDALVRMCLGYSLLVEGRAPEALPLLESAVDAFASREQARPRAWTAHARLLTGDGEGAVQAAQTAEELAEETGDHFAMGLALSARSFVSGLRGEFDEALELATRSVAEADASPGREGHRFQVHLGRAFVLAQMDRLDEALEAVQLGRRAHEEVGAAWCLPLYHGLGMLHGYWTGAWDEALSEWDGALPLIEDTGVRQGLVINASIKGLIAFHRDDLAGAEDAIGFAEAEFQAGPQGWFDWMVLGRALLMEASGHAEAALATLSNAWFLFQGTGIVSELPILGPDMVRLAIASGDAGLASNVAAAVNEVAEKNPNVHTIGGSALRCRGLAENDADVLLAAADAYRRGPRPLDLGLACEEAGAALAAGRAEEAPALLEEAAGLFERITAWRDLARTEARLRSLGIRRRRRRPRATAVVGWDSLTETELKVVGLVAEGLSNPQIAERMFLSRGTVRTHVSHALTKLGMSSRVELAAEAVRRGTQSIG